MIVQAIVLILFPLMMAVAASSDLLTMRISNMIPLILVGGFAVMSLAVGIGLSTVAYHVGASGLVLLISFAMFARGWIGGGDAKLAAATALWLGWAHLMDYLLIASVLGGLLTLALLQFRKFALPPVLARQEWVERLHRSGGGIPYGIALAAAALIVFPDTPWMKGLGG